MLAMAVIRVPGELSEGMDEDCESFEREKNRPPERRPRSSNGGSTERGRSRSVLDVGGTRLCRKRDEEASVEGQDFGYPPTRVT